MKHLLETSVRIALFVLILYVWSWVLHLPLSGPVNLAIIAGGVLLVFPIVWLGRTMLDRKPTPSRAGRITTFVHYAVVVFFGIAIVRAVATHQEWSGWVLPVPTEIGFLMVILTGSATLLAVANLAAKGLGAPFAIALSRKLAAEWLYAWTRNPMVLAAMALGLSLGIWFQSVMFVLWVLLLCVPALIAIVKVYEERELEIRFGAPYLAYKARTPMLLPRRPKR